MANPKYANAKCFVFSENGYDEITYTELCSRTENDDELLCDLSSMTMIHTGAHFVFSSKILIRAPPFPSKNHYFTKIGGKYGKRKEEKHSKSR